MPDIVIFFPAELGHVIPKREGLHFWVCEAVQR